MSGKRNPLIETTENEARCLVETALEREPELTRNGIGIYDRRRVRREGGEDACRAKLHEERARLRGALEEIAAAADWIKRQRLRKSPDLCRGSYGYKHDVEDWFRDRGVPQYVANGDFIAAALGLGIPGKRCAPDSLNMYFPFSRRTRVPRTQT